ncbi:MAG TPA: hypothetical protein VN753_14945 [Terracidiphilus sp.]|nr:hypothetical protein [Terracidiphilus sp.]
MSPLPLYGAMAHWDLLGYTGCKVEKVADYEEREYRSVFMSCYVEGHTDMFIGDRLALRSRIG